MNKQALLEGILFITGDEGASVEQICNTLDIDKDEVKELVYELSKEYEADNRGIKINLLGNCFKMTTKPIHKEYYKKMIHNNKSDILSQPALETLAIIAYNEPITRTKVDEIRGINSYHLIRKLIARNLIKDVGRADSLGRAILYSITNDFLDYFGLSSKDQLPQIEELNINEISEETDLFTAKYKED